MLIYRTYQLKGYATKAVHSHIEDALRLSAVLYNAALEERKSAYRHKGHSQSVSISKYDQMKSLTLIRRDNPEYADMSVQIMRGALTRLDRAMQAFYRRVKNGESAGFPRFKSKSRYNTIEVDDPSASMLKRSEDGERLFVKVKGLGVIRLRRKRELPDGKPKIITITKRPCGLVVNLTFALSVEPDADADMRPAIGIDMGVNKRLALSDGSVIPRRKRDNHKRRSLQRAISRCRKRSTTREKRVVRLRKFLHKERIRNRNEAHRITTYLALRYGRIALEDLHIRNMTARAHGKGVAQKRRLNGSVLEQTWGLMRRQLEYKAESAGTELLFVSPQYTSRTCSMCGTVKTQTFKRYTVFECDTCGLVMDRDVNAARVIRERGVGMFAPTA